MRFSIKEDGFTLLIILLIISIISISVVVFLSERSTLTPSTPTITPLATDKVSETQTDSDVWKTYEVEGLLSFQYPTSWTFSPDCNDQIALSNCIWTPNFLPYTLQTSINKTEVGAYMGMLVSHKQTPEAGKISISDYDSFCSGKVVSFKGICIKTTMLGKPALRMQTETNKVITSEEIHIILDDNNDLTISFKNSENEAEQERAVFEKILSSIHLTKK